MVDALAEPQAVQFDVGGDRDLAAAQLAGAHHQSDHRRGQEMRVNDQVRLNVGQVLAEFLHRQPLHGQVDVLARTSLGRLRTVGQEEADIKQPRHAGHPKDKAAGVVRAEPAGGVVQQIERRDFRLRGRRASESRKARAMEL